MIIVTVWQSLNAECKISRFCKLCQLFTWDSLEKVNQLCNVRLYERIKYISLLIRLMSIIIVLNIKEMYKFIMS